MADVGWGIEVTCVWYRDLPFCFVFGWRMHLRVVDLGAKHTASLRGDEFALCSVESGHEHRVTEQSAVGECVLRRTASELVYLVLVHSD